MLWQLGLALFELGQIDEAVATFESASIRTHLPPTNRGGKFLEIADFRRLEEVEQILQRLVAKSPANPRLIQTLASVRLDQDRNDEALAAASQAISLPGAQSHAFAVRGMVYLRKKRFQQAEDDFQKALELDASHIWALYGAGLCDERSGRFEQSLTRFHGASELATTDEQRSQCLMSAAQVNVFLQHYTEATNLIAAAAKLDPAVNISRWIRQLRQDSADSMSEPLALARQEFLRTADRLAQSNDFGFAEPAPETPQYVAPLLNGDFELGSLKYWDDESGASWRNVGGYQSSAAVSDSRAHNGRYSLRIRGNSIRDGAQWGITGQSFPVRPNSPCRIRCWVSAQNLQSNSLKLISANGQSLIEFPAGTYEWTKFEAEFDLPRGEDQSPVVPLRIEIRSTGNGTAWLDDLTVEVSEPRSNKNQL